jgi:hypothetical protein
LRPEVGGRGESREQRIKEKKAKPMSESLFFSCYSLGFLSSPFFVSRLLSPAGLKAMDKEGKVI